MPSAEEIETMTWTVANRLNDAWGEERDFFNRRWLASIRGFLRQLPLDEVLEAADLASIRQPNRGRSFSYFCGVCWNKIRDQAPVPGSSVRSE
jgi:hypothetical protein